MITHSKKMLGDRPSPAPDVISTGTATCHAANLFNCWFSDAQLADVDLPELEPLGLLTLEAFLDQLLKAVLGVECGDVIVGDPHVERVDDSERGDRPEFAFWCAACAYVEFVTGASPTRPRVPRVPG